MTLSKIYGTITRAVTEHKAITQVAVLVLLCLAAGIYSLSAGTDANWDLKNYHYYTAFAFFHDRLFKDIAPSQLQSFFPPLINIPTFLLIEYANNFPRLAAFIQGVPAGIYAYCALRLSMVVARSTLGSGPASLGCAAMATALSVTGAGFLPLVGTSTGDITAGTLILGALVVLLEGAYRGNLGLARLVIAALLTGIAVGLKLTAAIYVVAMCFVVVAVAGVRSTVAFSIISGVTFLALWGPHGFRLWMEFGNPLFPTFNNIFNSPDYFPVTLKDERFLPKTNLQYMIYPFFWAFDSAPLVTEPPMRDMRLSIGFVSVISLVVLGLQHWRTLLGEAKHSAGQFIDLLLARHRVAIALLIFVSISYALWIHMFSIYRYAIVLETLVAPLVLLAGASFLQSRSTSVAALMAMTVVIANVGIVRPNWGHAPFGTKIIDVGPMHIEPGSLVVIADSHPHGYLVPFMPRDAVVVSINSNFVVPGQAYRLNARIASVIRAHKGPFAVVTLSATSHGDMTRTLAAYGLIPGECSIVSSNIEVPGPRLCSATRR